MGREYYQDMYVNAIFILVITLPMNSAMIMGRTTRYWDCCKPSCAWENKAPTIRPVETCFRNETRIIQRNMRSGCEGGESFACSQQTAWAISSNLSYGFAAARIIGQTEADWCCTCYKLVFTSGPVRKKEMIVQITNTGGDLSDNHFDIAIPGGGQGLFSGCSMQYQNYRGGQLYGGIKSRVECKLLPKLQQPGCFWRFDWFKNADNPNVNATKVKCPKVITNISKCSRV